jgi:predicted Zn-dependent protease
VKKSDPQQFEGHAFHPDYGGNEAISGIIRVDRWRFLFESDEVTIDIALAELALRFSDEGDTRVFFEHSREPGWTIYTTDRVILRHRAFAEHNGLRRQVREVRERGVYFKAAMASLIFVAAFALIAIALTWVSGRMVAVVVARLPVEWETNFGNSILADFELEFDMVNDPELQVRMEALAAPLLEVLPDQGLEYQFHILDTEMPNAFALPGGHVLVSYGLIEIVDRPEEVAGVLAHEFAHVTHDHAFRQIVASAGPFVIFNIFLSGSGAMGTISAGSEFLMNQSFSKSYEYEADDVGWDYLVAANIDPRGLEEFLRKVRRYEQEMGGLEIDALSTHPATEDRIKRLENRWGKLKREGAFLDLNAEIRKAVAQPDRP